MMLSRSERDKTAQPAAKAHGAVRRQDGLQLADEFWRRLEPHELSAHEKAARVFVHELVVLEDVRPVAEQQSGDVVDQARSVQAIDEEQLGRLMDVGRLRQHWRSVYRPFCAV